MFKKCRRVVAVAVVCIFVTGIAAYAQTVQRSKNQDPARQQAMQQKMKQRQDAAAAPEGRFQKPIQARFGSLQALLSPPPPQVLQRLADRLGLSEEQKAQIKQLYVQFHETTKPIREQRMAALKAFMTAFRDPNVTKGDLESLSEPVLQAEKAILDAEFDFWLALRGTLNPQQQAQLESYMMNMAGRDLLPPGGERAPRTRGENPAGPAK